MDVGYYHATSHTMYDAKSSAYAYSNQDLGTDACDGWSNEHEQQGFQSDLVAQCTDEDLKDKSGSSDTDRCEHEGRRSSAPSSCQQECRRSSASSSSDAYFGPDLPEGRVFMDAFIFVQVGVDVESAPSPRLPYGQMFLDAFHRQWKGAD